MYESYYGLTKAPFAKDISPSELFSHDQHAEVLARLSYAVREKAIAILTGEVGSGKSVALRALSCSLDGSRHTVVYFFGLAGLRGFYSELVTSLGGIPRFLKAHLIAQARDLIATETTERRKNLIVIIDEAHVLEPGVLDEIRLLTNTEMDCASPFCLILSGQPTLAKKLHLSSLLALSQRVTLRCQLKGLSLEQTAGYIRHHLSIAGRGDNLFSDDAISLTHSASVGIPRRINNIATQALIAGYSEKKNTIDEATVRRAVAELQAD